MRGLMRSAVRYQWPRLNSQPRFFSWAFVAVPLLLLICPRPGIPASEAVASHPSSPPHPLLSQSPLPTVYSSVPDSLAAPRSTLNTRESPIAAYLDNWKRRVEQIGTINLPNEAVGRQLSGSPVIEVALRANGSLESVIVRRSSGNADLDNVVVGIVRLAAPFDPFPLSLRSRYPVLRFAYEWQFQVDRAAAGSDSPSILEIEAPPSEPRRDAWDEQAKREAAAAKAQRKADAQARAEREAAVRAEREAELHRLLASEEENAAAFGGSGVVDEYRALLVQTIQRNWIRPPSAQAGHQCTLYVTQAPGGIVTDVKFGACNGDAAVRESVADAIWRSSPLPLPRDPRGFQRRLEIVFMPH